MKTITINNPTLTKPLNPNGKYAILTIEDVEKCKRTMWGLASKNWQRGKTLYAIVLIDNHAHLCYGRAGYWNSIKEFATFKITETADPVETTSTTENKE